MLNTKTSSSSSVSSGSTSTMGAQEARITQHPVMQRPLRAQPSGQEYDLYEDIRKNY
ncbi:hypothetical protein [Escherichia coli]|uniref:hypothetical protein n=1 Tax=Escherichia coli TaxID=562 RepID=UPI003EBC133D